MVMVSPGQASDAPALLPMLAELRVARPGPARPRTTPDPLRADKAYSAREHRCHLRDRGIKAVIPEPSDQAGPRRRRGSPGGRPVTCDQVEYKRRAGIECGINVLTRWRGITASYDTHALTYRSAIVLTAVLT